MLHRSHIREHSFTGEKYLQALTTLFPPPASLLTDFVFAHRPATEKAKFQTWCCAWTEAMKRIKTTRACTTMTRYSQTLPGSPPPGSWWVPSAPLVGTRRRLRASDVSRTRLVRASACKHTSFPRNLQKLKCWQNHAGFHLCPHSYFIPYLFYISSWFCTLFKCQIPAVVWNHTRASLHLCTSLRRRVTRHRSTSPPSLNLYPLMKIIRDWSIWHTLQETTAKPWINHQSVCVWMQKGLLE